MDTSLFDSFKNPALARDLLDAIDQLATHLDRSVGIMEVCGTHTVALARGGFRSVLPKNLRLISGPGCPVCVTANADIDKIIALTRLPDVILASFGDMIRVPGSSTSLMERKAEGAAVEVIYSPLDALKLAQKHPDMQLVLAGVGFETTTPLIAATIERARALGLENFSVIAAHKRVPPALKALVNDPELALDGLILPGHVSTILGEEPYRFLADEYHLPGVITGFEPLDLLQGISYLLRQIVEKRARIENAYTRAVMPGGNPAALEAIARVFDVCDADWRGLGVISESGYAIREEFAEFDALRRFKVEVEPTIEPKGCRCGEVLRGLIPPNKCPLYGKACTPSRPIGPCMVSSEGSCAAWFRYRIEV
jgi:hydrogenase expression/formation protein HypD